MRVLVAASLVLATVLAASGTPPDRNVGPRSRSSHEIEDYSTYCFPDPRCIAEGKRVVAEGRHLRESTDDAGVIDNETWQRCVDAGCRLYDCGMPALPTILPWLLARYEATSELVTSVIDTYDLHHARAIIQRAMTLRWSRIDACRPQRPPGQSAPTDRYEQLAEIVYTDLYFTIAPTGSARIRIGEESLRKHPMVASCVVEVLRDLTFPPSIYGDTLDVWQSVHFPPTPSNLE